MAEVTTQEEWEKQRRSKKQMLWFGIASLVMMFVGLTSAYIVSSGSRKDFIEIELPSEFLWSTLIIFISSLTVWLGRRSIAKGKFNQAAGFTLITLILGNGFVLMQFLGFNSIIEMGYYFTGIHSNIAASFIYLIVVAHLAHIVAGLVCLIVMMVNLLRGKYTPQNHLGYELGATFWHFVDVLWIYLLLFLLFAKEVF